jgi:hypothetical protein
MHSHQVRISAKAMGEALFDSVLAEIVGREFGGPPHRTPDFFLLQMVATGTGDTADTLEMSR